jgi:hypothetical protein
MGRPRETDRKKKHISSSFLPYVMGALLSLDHVEGMVEGCLRVVLPVEAFCLCILLFCCCENVVKIFGGLY